MTDICAVFVHFLLVDSDAIMIVGKATETDWYSPMKEAPVVNGSLDFLIYKLTTMSAFLFSAFLL